MKLAEAMNRKEVDGSLVCVDSHDAYGPHLIFDDGYRCLCLLLSSAEIDAIHAWTQRLISNRRPHIVMDITDLETSSPSPDLLAKAE